MKKSEIQPTFQNLFYFVYPDNKLLVISAFTFSILQGTGTSLFTLIFGSLLDSFSPNNSNSEILSSARKNAIWMIAVGLYVLAASLIAVFLWKIIAIKQSKIVRERYLRALLYQNCA